MKVDVKALAYASAALCGVTVLCIGIGNMLSPDYGREFLELLSSVYPGYTTERSLDAVLVATGYAIVKGAVMGGLLGWLYNRLVK